MIVRFAGFGGQGIIISSFILGQSAVRDGLQAIQNQTYGSESRGNVCSGDVIISDDTIYELEPSCYDVLVAMTQPAYEKSVPSLRPGGTLIIDNDLVEPDGAREPEGITTYSLGVTEIAFKLFGQKIVANMVLLGYLNTRLELVSPQALAETIARNVPEGTGTLNLAAMREGIRLAENPD